MRIWSLHPKYLDRQGLVALWREGLLAKKVLLGQTKGYRNHPQLNRFKKALSSHGRINAYLHIVCDEAEKRGYHFDRTKLARLGSFKSRMPVTAGQMEYEWKHLLKKQFKRSRADHLRNKSVRKIEAHPIFQIVEGDIESWEVLQV